MTSHHCPVFPCLWPEMLRLATYYYDPVVWKIDEHLLWFTTITIVQLFADMINNLARKERKKERKKIQ